MFNLFKKKRKESAIHLVAEIHNEFDSASEKLLNESKELLRQKPTDKGDRLKRLGFANARSVKETEILREKEQEAKQLAENVAYFNQWYPHSKFITKVAVEQICAKYGLVFGDAIYYKGDVPEKNLREMEAFKLREEDMIKRTGLEEYSDRLSFEYMQQGMRGLGGRQGRPTYHQSLTSLSPEDISKLSNRVSYSKKPFKICAPEKDFEMKHLVRKGYKLEYDPIVLQPIKGGYLIVTKWGLESEDSELANEKMN